MRLQPVLNLDNPSLPALDGIRAIAIGLVILFHFVDGRLPGPLGVQIFFVLSGFLITHLLLREGAHRGRISLRDFYIRRMLRIFPAFYTYITVLVVVIGSFPPGYVASAYTYVINYYIALHGNFSEGLYHTWSLAVEEQFYLLWPAVFLLLSSDLRRLLQLTAALVVAGQFYKLVLAWAGAGGGYIYAAFDSRGMRWRYTLLLGIVFTFGMAILSYYVVEMPFLKLKSRFQRIRPDRTMAAKA